MGKILESFYQKMSANWLSAELQAAIDAGDIDLKVEYKARQDLPVELRPVESIVLGKKRGAQSRLEDDMAEESEPVPEQKRHEAEAVQSDDDADF